MGNTYRIECPHCKAVFPLPTKRHIFTTKTKTWRTEGTLCGQSHQNMRLIVKEGEEPNCKSCLRRKAQGWT